MCSSELELQYQSDIYREFQIPPCFQEILTSLNIDEEVYLGICGRRFPSLSTKSAPAASRQRWWRFSRERRHVVGVSLSAVSAFLRGANSSSRMTSQTAKLLSHLKQKATNKQGSNKGDEVQHTYHRKFMNIQHT